MPEITLSDRGFRRPKTLVSTYYECIRHFDYGDASSHCDCGFRHRSDIEKAVNWYQSRFDLEAIYVDESWALLQFESIGLALVLLGQHPPHIAIGRKNVESYGSLTAHRDGIAPVYIQAPMGNSVEIMKADR